MAAPEKKKMDYFPLDVNIEDDEKLSMIIAEFGGTGEYIFIKLLSFIYSTKGYYIIWDEMTQLQFAKRVKYTDVSLPLIKEIVDKCLKWGIFNSGIYSVNSALTSERIQKTWFLATRKRKGRNIDGSIWIDAALIPEGTIVNSAIYEQRKEKKRKEKESIRAEVNSGINSDENEGASTDTKTDKITEAVPTVVAVYPQTDAMIGMTKPGSFNNEPYVTTTKNPHAPTKTQVEEFFMQQGRSFEEAHKFFNNYEAIGWRRGINPIFSWRHIAQNWIIENRAKETTALPQETNTEDYLAKRRRQEEKTRQLEGGK